MAGVGPGCCCGCCPSLRPTLLPTRASPYADPTQHAQKCLPTRRPHNARTHTCFPTRTPTEHAHTHFWHRKYAQAGRDEQVHAERWREQRREAAVSVHARQVAQGRRVKAVFGWVGSVRREQVSGEHVLAVRCLALCAHTPPALCCTRPRPLLTHDLAMRPIHIMSSSSTVPSATK